MKTLKRVMCVDDDPDIRTVLEFSLRKLGGYEVKVCSSGQEALAEASHFLPELVLLDVMMPEMDGVKTLAAFHLLPCMKNIPIVFLTAKATREELEELLTYGASGVIIKPFDPVTLPQNITLYWNPSDG
jgi:CheY-like chemotaxis protein